MDKFGYPWFVAGAWAMDLFLGRETRAHGNIDIGIYRKNQMQLYRYFGKQDKYYVDNKNRVGKHVRREWKKEYLWPPVQELYVGNGDHETRFFLDEAEGDYWVYGGDGKVRLEGAKAILFSDGDIPYLCPEIVALYKTGDMQAKDRSDISNAAPTMADSGKRWLLDSIRDETRKREMGDLLRVRD